MAPDLTLEVIYYGQPTDFKMEFDLCGCMNLRFLSASVKERGELVSAIGKSIVRSRVMVIVGSFNPASSEYLPGVIAKVLGYVVKPVDKSKFDITAPGEYFLPDTALPLVDVKGSLAGCVLESNDQSIIMLTAERDLRHRVIKELVCPYLNFFARKNGDTPSSTETVLAGPVEVADKDEAQANIKADDGAGEELPLVEDIPLVEAFAKPDNTDEPIDDKAPFMPGYAILESAETQKAEKSDELYYTDEGDKPKKKRKKLKAFISLLLVLAVLLGTFFGYTKVYQPIQTDRIYEEMRELYGQTWEGLPEDMLYKFGCLYQTNPDIYGWIDIPGTSINYPVVTSSAKSASYYENHLFEGSFNNYGTLYTPGSLSNGEYSRNIVIYGKDMPGGAMFSDLKKYLDLRHYREVPTFTFDTLYLEHTWKIFSVYQIKADKESDFVRTEFFDDNEYAEYLKFIQKISMIKTNIEVKTEDQIVTLVCRTDGADIAIAARCVRTGEVPMVDITDSELTDYANDSSAIEAVTVPSYFVEVDPNEEEDEPVEDENMADGASSRYEQEVTSSTIVITPDAPTTSIPNSSSNVTSRPSSSTNNTTSSVTTSKPSSSSSSTVSSTNGSKKLPVLTVTNTFTGKKVSGPGEEILAQIVEAEMGSSYNIEALKAQTVAAYSWLLCHGAADGKAPSAPLKAAKARSIEAVRAVAGEVATYGGKVATTYYYAISAGKTANGADIWGIKDPYLLSVDSSVDKSVSGYQTIRKYAAVDVAKWVNEAFGVDLTKSGLYKEDWFKCTYDANGVYVKQVDIGGKKVHGKDLREKLFLASRICSNGESLGSSNVLRSCAYTIKYSQSEDKFVFTVNGYGHGVGMSQTGANAYAKSGWDYKQILKHYYTGISFGTYYAD